MTKRSPSPSAIVAELRKFGLTYPGAHTKSPWPTHKDLAVNDKTFAYLSAEGETPSVSCKLPTTGKKALKLPFTKPTGYGLGKSGWVTADFGGKKEPPLPLLKEWIDESYRAQAPKKLIAQLPGGSSQGRAKAGAGYSSASLTKKLGIKAGHTLAVLNDPGHFGELTAPLPPDVVIKTSARGKADVVVLFVRQKRELDRRLGAVGRVIFPSGALWISWPKKASKVPTDVTEDRVREAALPLGLVDIKVAAIDEVWSGLKLVWRRERR